MKEDKIIVSLRPCCIIQQGCFFIGDIMRKEKLIKSTVTGVFCALAFILTVVLRFKVSFLSFDLKDTVIAVISLMYGPLYGVASAGVVALLEFLSVSDTGVYGLIMNFASSATFAFVAGVIYKNKRNFKGAILAVVFSVISVVIVMMLANILITPYYMGVSAKTVIGLIPTLLLPFNFCKALINAAATVVIYKPIRNILRKSGIEPEAKIKNENNLKKNIIVCVIALLLIVVTVVVLINILGGKIEFFS
jgi:riboflavin transporter FmnP